MKINIKKLHPDAIIPTYATDGSACFDLYACFNTESTLTGLPITQNYPRIIDTGIAFEIPPGYVLMVYSRSGHGFKNNIRLANCTGVCDSDFRGSVKVKLARDSSEYDGFMVRQGDRIAQAMITPVPAVEFVEVDEISETKRGNGGFGSTGA